MRDTGDAQDLPSRPPPNVGTQWVFRGSVGELELSTEKLRFTTSLLRTFLQNHSGAPPACGVLCEGQLRALALFIPELAFLVPATVYRGRRACVASGQSHTPPWLLCELAGISCVLSWD